MERSSPEAQEASHVKDWAALNVSSPPTRSFDWHELLNVKQVKEIKHRSNSPGIMVSFHLSQGYEIIRRAELEER